MTEQELQQLIEKSKKNTHYKMDVYPKRGNWGDGIQYFEISTSVQHGSNKPTDLDYWNMMREQDIDSKWIAFLSSHAGAVIERHD